MLRTTSLFAGGSIRQDKDPKHTAKSVERWFGENRVPVLPWPSQSPVPVLTTVGNFTGTFPSAVGKLTSALIENFNGINKLLETVAKTVTSKLKAFTSARLSKVINEISLVNCQFWKCDTKATRGFSQISNEYDVAEEEDKGSKIKENTIFPRIYRLPQITDLKVIVEKSDTIAMQFQ